MSNSALGRSTMMTAAIYARKSTAEGVTGSGPPAGAVVVRSDLEEMATRAGLQPVASVTKKGCDLLVTADPSSMSDKTKKARR